MGKTYKDQFDPWGKKRKPRKPRKGVSFSDSPNSLRSKREGNDEERNFEKFKPKR